MVNNNYSGFNICIEKGSLLVSHKQVNLTTFYTYNPKPIIIPINFISVFKTIKTLYKNLKSLFNFKINLSGWITKLKSWIAKIAKKILKFLKDKLESFFDAIAKKLKSAIQNIIKSAKLFIKFIAAAFKTLYKLFKLIVKGLYYLIIRAYKIIKDLYNVFKYTVSTIIKCIAKAKKIATQIKAAGNILSHIWYITKNIPHHLKKRFVGFGKYGGYIFDNIRNKVMVKGKRIIVYTNSGFRYLQVRGNKIVTLMQAIYSSSEKTFKLFFTKEGRQILKVSSMIYGAAVLNDIKFWWCINRNNPRFYNAAKQMLKNVSNAAKISTSKAIAKFKNILIQLINIIKNPKIIIGVIKMLASKFSLFGLVLGLIFETFELDGFGSNYLKYILTSFAEGHYLQCLTLIRNWVWSVISWANPVVAITDAVIATYKAYTQYFDKIVDYIHFITTGEIPKKSTDDAIIEKGKFFTLNTELDIKHHSNEIHLFKSLNDNNILLWYNVACLYTLLLMCRKITQLPIIIMQIFKHIQCDKYANPVLSMFIYNLILINKNLYMNVNYVYNYQINRILANTKSKDVIELDKIRKDIDTIFRKLNEKLPRTRLEQQIKDSKQKQEAEQYYNQFKDADERAQLLNQWEFDLKEIKNTQEKMRKQYNNKRPTITLKHLIETN